MRKHELIVFLEPFDDEVEIFVLTTPHDRPVEIKSAGYRSEGGEGVVLLVPMGTTLGDS